MSGEKRLWIASGGGGFRFPGMGGSGSRGFDQTQIRQAMEIASLLGVGVVLDRPIEAWAIADEVAATGSMAVVSPRQRVENDEAAPDTTGSNIAQSAILHAAGVPVAVTTPSGRFGGSPSIGTGGIMGQDLNTPHVDAAFAVRGGMPNRAALRTLTLDSAKIANADRRVGSIEAGKDADILILDGDPLHYKTFVETALVNGKVVYRKDDEPFYRHIRR
ncbi:MAG: amidohydrolase family protein [Planctomycetota bacterium]|nr:amidohydrolase family protein [Planctomycetota bacterium]